MQAVGPLEGKRSMETIKGFDIDAPRWDQSTFMGRLKHFFTITDCRTVLLPDSRLDEAKQLVDSCRLGSVPPGTTEEQLHYAKKLYDSAFHPDTGDRMNLIGRMTVPAVVFWQWVNQSFNALVNYTNRNAASPITPKQIGVAYVTATSTALATAVGLNLYTKKAPPLVARWVPFAAVAAANCVNIPMMRQQEILNGIAVTDEDGNKLGHSRKAAEKGITQVVISRVTMAAPGMIILPIIMQRLEKHRFMQVSVVPLGVQGSHGETEVMFRFACFPLNKITFLHGPLQVMMVGVFLVFMVPAACSLFPQKCSMAVSKLEPELRESIASRYGDRITHVYFNKGL
ncbi:hypothetical protein DNTS_027174 [Danionella cerebrum]|uniref:Sidoreflexin n=1 Tax=Danionella cerebrum TaxID=2873325 RepID=A0A553N2W6_9TELE|nr:hypothetical protein DNTS_027174 [Danionella translucida]